MVADKIIFVAELTINHLGMINIVKQMIKSAKNAGANLIKLKLKNVESYYKDDNKKWRNLNFKEYRKSLELSEDDFFEIDKYCKDLNIQWFCTIHDKEGLEFVKKFDVPLYKIASMDSDKTSFVNTIIETCKLENKPLIISVGGKDLNFINDLVNRINNANIKAYLLHTVSIYPTPSGKSNINFIKVLQKKYSSKNIKIGYSGHEIGYAGSILAAMNNISMLERHFTLSRDWKIHHIEAALLPEEYNSMTSLINAIHIEENQIIKEYEEEELDFLKKMEYK